MTRPENRAWLRAAVLRRFLLLGSLAATVAAGCADDSRCLVVVAFSVESAVPPLDRTTVNFPGLQPVDVTDLNRVDLRDGLELGFFVPAVSGSVTIQAFGFRGDCLVASGEAADVAIAPGKVVHTSIVLQAVSPVSCPPPPSDGGGDATAPDGGEPDGGADGAAGDTLDSRAAGDTADARSGTDAMEAPAADGGAGDGGGLPTCKTYCDALIPACPNNAETMGDCEALCALFFPPVPPNASPSAGEQLDCRLQWVQSQAAGLMCSAGGFSGGGYCGLGDIPHAWCDVYCKFAGIACDEFGLTPTQCSQECGSLSTGSGTTTRGNNVPCRIRQLIIAGGVPVDQRATTCASASITPTTGPCM